MPYLSLSAYAYQPYCRAQTQTNSSTPQQLFLLLLSLSSSLKSSLSLPASRPASSNYYLRTNQKERTDLKSPFFSISLASHKLLFCIIISLSRSFPLFLFLSFNTLLHTPISIHTNPPHSLTHSFLSYCPSQLSTLFPHSNKKYSLEHNLIVSTVLFHSYYSHYALFNSIILIVLSFGLRLPRPETQ